MFQYEEEIEEATSLVGHLGKVEAQDTSLHKEVLEKNAKICSLFNELEIAQKKVDFTFIRL